MPKPPNSINFLFIVLLIPFIGCAGKIKANCVGSHNLPIDGKYFVIKNDFSTKIPVYVFPIIFPGGGTVGSIEGQPETVDPLGNTAEILKDELTKYGIDTYIGKESDIPNDTKIIVTYNDIWERDFVMYLRELNVRFVSAEEKTLLAEGHFEASHLHNYPTPESEVPKIIQTILKETVK